MDATFIQARIDATKAQIVAYEDAALAFANNGALQAYTIDTGQTRQTVTRAQLSEIQRTIESLYNRCATLETRLNGAGTFTGRPAW